MTEEDAWDYLLRLDDELLQGGVSLSEWSTRIVQEADVAFAKGAYLASILVAVAAIETHLRAEAGSPARSRLVELIDGSDLEADLREDLHRLRKYRNRWVHVDNPANDDEPLQRPEAMDSELEETARFAARALRRTIYADQWV